MRPQHITAENHAHGVTARADPLASMRPQHITAENSDAGAKRAIWARFNEAAAYHCGKLGRITREPQGAYSFNEAAAYHCGKLARTTFESQRCDR